jgi:hypothetical protein
MNQSRFEDREQEDAKALHPPKVGCCSQEFGQHIIVIIRNWGYSGYSHGSRWARKICRPGPEASRRERGDGRVAQAVVPDLEAAAAAIDRDRPDT